MRSMVSCVLVLVMLFVVGCSPSVPREVAEAQAALRDRLRDPGSVVFENVRHDPASGSVCGDYNAKNAFGGYVGRERFAYQGGQLYASLGSARKMTLSEQILQSRICNNQALKPVTP